MEHNAQRPNDAAVRKCGKMSGDLVVLVDFKFFRDTLFDDEDFVSHGIYCRHEGVCGSDLNYHTQFRIRVAARTSRPSRFTADTS